MNLNIKLEKTDNLIINIHHLMKTNQISEAELARSANIPQPTLHKILSGKTNDPRASTLKALADFFKISIDDLLTGDATSSYPLSSIQSIPIINWKDCLNNFGFIKTLNANNWTKWVASEYLGQNVFGLVSKSSMAPRFPKGTTLIIDPDLTPEDGDIILVHYPKTEESTLRILSIDGPVRLLLPITGGENTFFKNDIDVLGVLVKSLFSYHL